nr:FIST N-terminal domain-containing protein [uncultured Holophaga sp.]
MGSSFYSAFTHCEVVDAHEAITEAISHCLGQLAGRPAGAILLLAGAALDHQLLLDALQVQWPGVPLIGCTTDGEFSPGEGYTEDSLLLLVLGSATVAFASCSLDLAHPLGPQCQELKARQQGRSPRLGILLADALSYMGEDAMLALQEAFGQGFPLVGGASADSWTFEGNRQFHGREVLSGCAVCLLFFGDFRFGHAAETGWKPIGRTGVVTRVARNVVIDIDGRPALDFYRDLMGRDALPSVDTPTVVYDPEGHYLYLRTFLLPIDPLDGYIRYTARVPPGAQVRVALMDRDSVVGAARGAALHAREMFGPGDPGLAICFSCSARRVVLGTRAIDECASVSQVLGAGVHVVGAYFYGEICPPEAGAPSIFNNESFVVLLLA